MGVVRREGDWRLEKRGEGVYEISFRKETQLRVVTEDAAVQPHGISGFDVVSTRHVSSYAEAEGLFEEKAHGGAPLGMQASSSGGGLDAGGNVDLSELPPFGIGATFLLAGGFLLYAFWSAGNSLVLLFGAGMMLVGAAPFTYAGYLARNDGWRTAVTYLADRDDGSSPSKSSTSGDERTPPAPQRLKDKLFFDRAEQTCEWCEEPYDHLEVHHIEPRSEGGPNTPANLIVLCPNCHEKADREAIPRSKLRAKVERLPAVFVD